MTGFRPQLLHVHSPAQSPGHRRKNVPTMKRLTDGAGKVFRILNAMDLVGTVLLDSQRQHSVIWPNEPITRSYDGDGRTRTAHSGIDHHQVNGSFGEIPESSG